MIYLKDSEVSKKHNNYPIQMNEIMNHFKLSEFDSPDFPGSGKNMNIEFLQMIDNARELSGHPIKINSGYRTVEHNAIVGGSDTSSHLAGRAADLHCNTSSGRCDLITALIGAAFRRIGIGKNFLHVDNDPRKIDAIWLYK